MPKNDQVIDSINGDVAFEGMPDEVWHWLDDHETNPRILNITHDVKIGGTGQLVSVIEYWRNK
jgi:hypothetical protein